jgi:tetratricopeptide (TPR) repeat protein
MNTRFIVIWPFLMVLCLGGCAHFGNKPEKSPEKAFLETSLREARESEERGDWVKALEDYKIAATVSPANKEAMEGRRLVEDRLKSLAEEQYRRGKELQSQGKLAEARQHLLTALRLWPEHAGAVETLTTRKRLPVQGYMLHKLKPGESLSKLALIYYGDAGKFPIIAGYNQIQDAYHVQVGQEIKVPLLADQEVKPPEEERLDVEEKEAPQDYWDWASIEVEPAEAKPPLGQEKAEEPDQITTYRELGMELFREGRYEEALFEFNKVLCVYPHDGVAVDYGYQASFEVAVALFQRKEYLAARNQFMATLKYKSDSPQCHAYLKQSEELYKEMHYKRGIEYYGKEQLAEAIREWEMVEAVDAGYKRVDYYIRKAKEIQKKLEELKRETLEAFPEG